MFHIGKLLLHRAVYTLRDPVGVAQGDVRFHRDLQVHIDPVAELPRTQQVDPPDAVLGSDEGAQPRRCSFGPGRQTSPAPRKRRVLRAENAQQYRQYQPDDA